MKRNRGERGNGGCSQSVTQKRKVCHAYLGSCFEHVCLASPANGPPIDMLAEQMLHICLSSCTGSYQGSLLQHVKNDSSTALLCEREGYLHKERRIYLKKSLRKWVNYTQRPAGKCLCGCMFAVFGDITGWK